MGHPDGAHTHGSGGSDLGAALLVILGAALFVNAAPVVLGAAAELLHVFLIVAGVVVGTGAAGVVGLLTWRWRRKRLTAARAGHALQGAVHPLPAVARAAQPLPEPRPAIERAPEVHLHLHGVSAEDVAAIIRQQQPAAQPAIEED
jgi:hypothetical protein